MKPIYGVKKRSVLESTAKSIIVTGNSIHADSVLFYNKTNSNDRDLPTMLNSSKQSALPFHAELYNLIPEGHILRNINEAFDYSFIHDLVSVNYSLYYGRPAN